MEIPRHWRLKAQRYRLEGSICPTCGQLSFPPRLVCPQCAARCKQDVADFELMVIPPFNHLVNDIPPERMIR
jgi:uncharacterized OB-fold protein